MVCPSLEEIGVRVDETTVALPIDHLFQNIEGLAALDLRFDVPRSLIYLNKDPEEIMGRPFG